MTTLIAQPSAAAAAAAIPRAPAIPLVALPELPPEIFHRIRRRMVLDCCKWDPQVGDVSTLAPFALSISRATWRQLSAWSEAMSHEALAAEAELLRRPDLHRQLGLPRRIRRLLRREGESHPSPAAARTIRFDFHWTTDGWR